MDTNPSRTATANDVTLEHAPDDVLRNRRDLLDALIASRARSLADAFDAGDMHGFEMDLYALGVEIAQVHQLSWRMRPGTDHRHQEAR